MIETTARSEAGSAAVPSAEALFFFLDDLRREGYRIDARHIAAAQCLLAEAHAEGAESPTARRIKFRLAPLIAKSPSQQQDFYRRFDAWHGAPEVAGRIEPAAPPPAGPATEVVKRDPRRRVIAGVVAVFLTVAALATWYFWPPPPQEETPPQEQRVAPPQEQRVAPPQEQRVAPPPEETRPPAGKAFEPPEERLEIGRQVVSPFHDGIKFALAAAPLLAFAAWVLVRWRRRLLLMSRGIVLGDAALGSVRLPLKLSDVLFTGPELRGSAHDLRKHRYLPTRRLDAWRTVDATARRAGLFTPVYRDRPQLPEYVFLIEQNGSNDHLARLFELAVDRLRDEQVEIQRFYFHTDPRQVQADDRDRSTIPLAELAARTDDHRLFVIATADGFFHPLTGEVKGWVQRLEPWRSRTMLSTRPLEQWTMAELRLLEEGFSLATAEASGFAAAGEKIAVGTEEAELLEGVVIMPMPTRQQSEASDVQRKRKMHAHSAERKRKRAVPALTMLLLLAMPLMLLFMCWNHTPRYFFSLAALAWRSELTIPPAATPLVSPSLKFYGSRENQDFALRLEAITSKRFEIDTGTKIESYNPSLEDRLPTLKKVLASQSIELDAMLIDIIWANELAPYLMDLRPFLEKEINLYDQQFIENNIVENRLVAIPWFQNIGLLFYRKDLLMDSGLGVPDTWEQLEEAAAKIQAKQKEKDPEFIGFAWQGAPYEGLTCNALEWIASWGGLDTNTGLPLFDHPGVLDALDHARRWVNGESAISPYAQHHMEEESLQTFLNGKAAFLRGWSDAYAALKRSGIEFGVAPLPRGMGDKSFGMLGGWQLAVPQYSLNQRSAIEFIRYLSSPEVQEWRAREGSYRPTIENLIEDVDVQEALPFLKDDWFHDIQLIIRPSSRLGDRYNKVSECIYASVGSALNRNSRDEIKQDIVEMKNCIDRESIPNSPDDVPPSP